MRFRIQIIFYSVLQDLLFQTLNIMCSVWLEQTSTDEKQYHQAQPKDSQRTNVNTDFSNILNTDFSNIHLIDPLDLSHDILSRMVHIEIPGKHLLQRIRQQVIDKRSRKG